MNNVEQFIRGFQSQESKQIFLGNCSYWFATILYRRFIRDGAVVMFNKSTERFGTMIQGTIYDITGKIPSQSGWISWLNFQDSDEKQKIIDKYIMF